MPARRKFLSLREARATQEPFQVGRTKAPIKSVAAPSNVLKRKSPAGDDKNSDSGRPSDADPAATPKRRRPLGTLSNTKAKTTVGVSAATTTTQKPASRSNARPQPQQQKPQLKRPRPRGASTPADTNMRDLKALLARHNKKFKTAHHTYEPPQHSVRDVKMVRIPSIGRSYLCRQRDADRFISLVVVCFP